MNKEPKMKRLQWIAALMLLTGSGLFAAGTAAGTDINNSVQLSFEVGGVSQQPVTSNTDTFKVDRKIDVIVDATNTPLDVPPAAQDQNLSFVIVNQGNDQETFDLAGTYNLDEDNFNPQNCQITDTNGETLSQVLLAVDANVTVYVSCDIPDNTQVQADDNGTVSLKATVNGRTNDSNYSDDPAVVQNVFADGAGTDDDQHKGDYSDRGTYHIVSPNLTASKTSCVVNDPVNGTTKPKRIPGATIRYAIEVSNSGNTDADSVSTTDALSGDLTYSAAYIREGSCSCASPSGTDNEGDASTSNSGQDVTLDFGTVEANSKECAYIEATIN
jgi:uncharacterized repeat protein (TIGR01451 family)